MNDFDYEVMQRRNLARQAKYRKNGSKSKKCSLPSDGMSQKQWKERNGKVMEYNLNKPMSWEQFKALPEDVQLQYIERLRSRYNASVSAISKMFGLSPASLNNYLYRKGMEVKGSGRLKFSAAQAKVWERFCNGDEAEPKEEADSPSGSEVLPDEVVAGNGAVTADCEAQNPVKAIFDVMQRTQPVKKSGMLLNSFTLQFGGEFDPDAIRNSLAMILQKGQRCRIEISCTTEAVEG